MKSNTEIKNIAIKAIQTEAQSIADLSERINDDFSTVIHKILDLNGRVIITGIGKSAIIAQKIVATFNSTGTPSVFMHAADAIHGDLGIIQPNDLVMIISKSGNTPEIKALIPFLKQKNNLLVALVGNLNSYLSQQADFILNVSVDKEACPNNLAPTSSTTAQLVMGDALAIALLECRSFTNTDFAKFHPGGTLGKQLYLTVADVISPHIKPQVSPDSTIKEVILEITKNRLGAVTVLQNNQITGIITDGDVRRMIERFDNISNVKAKDIMGKNPILITRDKLAMQALEIMKQHSINHLIVTDDQQEYQGIIHIQDLVKEGLI